MCRLAAYLGDAVILDDVLVKPKYSIVMQSLHARETDIPTNGDGFGVGWYAPELSSYPGIFTSISPAWNDLNLLHLTSKIVSPCFFAHVRAASAGGVSNDNCHPFAHGQWMMMHNGGIYDFINVKRHMRHLLDDDIYHLIRGETDSEHLFALFLQLAKNKDISNLASVGEILVEALHTTNKLVHQYTNGGSSYYNLCLTDGNRMVAVRYCSDKRRTPDSMHYLTHDMLEKNAERLGLKTLQDKSFVLVTSERLNAIYDEWRDIPPHHMMLVENNTIEFVAI